MSLLVPFIVEKKAISGVLDGTVGGVNACLLNLSAPLFSVTIGDIFVDITF
jgi:hypothetical protein